MTSSLSQNSRKILGGLLIGLFAIGGGCTHSASSPSNPVSQTALAETKKRRLESDIEALKTYLEHLDFLDVESLRGETYEARLVSQQKLYHSYATRLAINGIDKQKLLKVVTTESALRAFLRRYVEGQASFNESLNLAELTVMATVGKPVPNKPMSFAGPGFFELDVSSATSTRPIDETLIVANASSTHVRILETGKACVFFLSSTRREYLNMFQSDLPDYLLDDLPNNLWLDSFPAYCALDGETFQSHSQLGGLKEIKRSEVLRDLKKASEDRQASRFPRLNRLSRAHEQTD